MKRLVVAVLTTLTLTATALMAPFTATADPVETTAVVLKIVDGDTIDIRDDIRGRLRVRVLGIDTPETKKPGHTVGCWGPQAAQFAHDTLLGQRVAVVIDPTQDRTDSYGRTLAYLVKRDGWNYSVEATRAGAARAYIYGGKPVQMYPEIARAERQAKEAGRGLWGPPCFGATESTAIDSPFPPATPPTTALPDNAPPADISGILEHPSGVYFGSCAEARAVGAAPLPAGQAGYRPGLDGDGDGVACE